MSYPVSIIRSGFVSILSPASRQCPEDIGLLDSESQENYKNILEEYAKTIPDAVF